MEPQATRPELPVAAQGREWRGREWLRRTFADAPDIFQHTAALVLSVLSIWLVHGVVARLLGGDAKFFDVLPIRWFFDAAHAAVLTKFVWKLTKQIWNG